MMTFKEFLNQRDHKALSSKIQPPGGMNVIGQVFQNDALPSLDAPKPPDKPASVKPAMPAGTMMGRRFSDPGRASSIPNKPSQFLARKGSSFRKNF